jgi:two-component system, NarL family, sensor kinase
MDPLFQTNFATGTGIRPSHVRGQNACYRNQPPPPRLKSLFFLLTILLFYASFAHGQDTLSVSSTLDSLFNLPDSKEKVDALNQFAFDKRMNDSENSFKAAKEAVSIAKNLNYESGVAGGKWVIGYKYKAEAEYDLALQYFNECIAIREKLNQRNKIPGSLDQISFIYRDKGDNFKYSEYLFKALKIREEIGDEREIAKSYMNIGNSFDARGNYYEALYYHNKSLEIWQRLGDEHQIALIQHNIGICYYHLEKLDTAIEYYRQSLSFFESEADSSQMANIYNDLGLAFIEIGIYDGAVHYLYLAKTIDKNLNQFKEMGTTYLNYGILYFRNKDYANSLSMLNSSEIIANHFGQLDLLEEVTFYKFQVFGAIHKYKEAIAYFEKYAELDSSLLEKNRLTSFYKIQNMSRNLSDIYYNSILSEEERKYRNNIFLLVLVIFFLLTIIFFVNKVSKQRRMIILNKAKIHRHEINTLLKRVELGSAWGILEGQEGERQRIAKELHDRVGSMLSTTKLYFSVIEEKLNTLHIDIGDKFPLALSLLDDACEEVRRISHNVESGNVEQFGLVTALEYLSNILNGTGKIRMQLVVQKMIERLSGNLEISLYRIIQELVSNVLKHADANELTIQVLRYDEMVTIMVEDNGKGISKRKMDGKGMGLNNVYARVEQIKGKIVIDSTRGKGTTIIIDIPLSKHKSGF